MHSYSIDTKERRNILLILALVSIFLAWFLSTILNKYKIILPWWFESPSILFFYGLLFVLFNRWLWKYLKKLHMIKTPNLSGEWNGFLKSSFDEHSEKIKANLKIFQTWTSIKIILTTEHSSSYSEAASILVNMPEGKGLSYLYVNEPKSNAAETMSIHRGTARLLFEEKSNVLDGEYYSGRDRQNIGSLHFKRK